MADELFDEDSVLLCLLCLHNYDEKEHRPKFLQCHHSFCLVCLNQWVKNNEISCPTCRKITNVPKRGVAAFPNDFTLMALLAKREKKLRKAAAASAQQSSQPKNPQIWCKTCSSIAKEPCLTDHDFTNLKQVYGEGRERLRKSVVDTKKNLTETLRLRAEEIEEIKRQLTDADAFWTELQTQKSGQELELDMNKSLLDEIVSLVPSDDTCNAETCTEMMKNVAFVEDTAVNVKKEVKDLKERARAFNQLKEREVHVTIEGTDIEFDFKLDNWLNSSYLTQFMLANIILKHSGPKIGPSMHIEVERKPIKNGTANGADQWGGDGNEELKTISYKEAAKKPVTTKAETIIANPFHKPRFPHVFFDIAVNGDYFGRIVFLLRDDVAPKMCRNFVALCCNGGQLGYRGSLVYKTVRNDQILGGDILYDNGSGGKAAFPDYDENSFLADRCSLKDEKGAIRMKGLGRDDITKLGRVSSQFLIWVGDRDYKDYPSSLVFGKVVQGLDVAQNISHISMRRWPNGAIMPSSEIRIIDCGNM